MTQMYFIDDFKNQLTGVLQNLLGVNTTNPNSTWVDPNENACGSMR